MISLNRLKRKSYGMAVIGAGPAGVSAAINAGVRKMEVLLIEPEEPMSKIRKAKVVPNYPGFPSVKGSELADAFIHHLDELEIEKKRAKVLQISSMGRKFIVYTEKEVFEAKAVILAVGVISERKIEGEEELVGEGVSYCITCDGLAFQGEKISVIADGEEGEEDAMALAEEYQCKVIYLPQYSMTNKLPNSIRVVNTKPRSLKAEGGLIEIDTAEEKIRVKGVFIIRKDLSPASLMERLEMKKNFIHVNNQMATNVKGVFAAGDCTGPPFQIAKAAGEGQIAALSAVKYLSRERGE